MRISVIIPIKNGARTLGKCLNMIKRQTIKDIEIIILNSMSTDDSRKIAENYQTRIIDIPNGTFNHGATRNLGIQYANGDLIYFTVQDACLTEDNQLEKMAAYFTDVEIKSVTGIQAIPNDTDKNPAIWFKRFSKAVPEVRQFSENSFKNLPVKKQLAKCDWDNVNAMYRRTALQTLSFKTTDLAEDALWARDALLQGWKIIRDPSLVVYHYHHQDFKYSFKVRYILNYCYYKYFHVYPSLPAFVKPLITAWYRIFKNEKISIRKKIYWSRYNLISLTGNYLSNLIFLIMGKLFSERGLEKSLKLFCGQIPQGKLKK